MKSYLKYIVFALLPISFKAAPDTRKQPVYIYLSASVTDHVNLDITEDRLRRLLPTIERYEKEHPEAHVSATVLFSGAVSQALADRNASTHIVDFVKQYLRKGIIEAGYDGADEPTYLTRPILELTKENDPQSRWVARKKISQEFLTQGRDPLTGMPDPSTSGGLKKMQEVFGEAAFVTGLTLNERNGPGMATYGETKVRGPAATAPAVPPVPKGITPEIGGDTETVINVRNMNSRAVFSGLPDVNPAQIPGFGMGRDGFSRMISPEPDTSPELFWQDGVVRSSETSTDAVRLIHANGGPDEIKKVIEKAERGKVRVVRIVLGQEQNYLKPEFVKAAFPSLANPALKYAYEHPTSPKLPEEALAAKSDVDHAYANEDALLTWVTSDFLPGEAGSRFVSSADLTRMAGPASGFRISIPKLQQALAGFMADWGNNTYGPAIFKADGKYLSRAEMFQVMADALAAFHHTGKLPDSVEVIPVYGPVRVLTGHGPNAGEVSMSEVARLCSEIAPGLHDHSPGDFPKNSVPIGVTVEGGMLNPAQFLRLMAFSVLNPSPDSKLQIRMSYEFTALAMQSPKTRPDADDGYAWTMKPALIETKPGMRAAL